MVIVYAMLALVAGMLNTVQAGANTTLSKTLEQPILATLIVALVGAVTYLAAAPFFGLGLPSYEKVAQVPWWGWIGGILGAFYVLCMVFLANRLGAAIFTGVTVTAAIVTSVILDHFALVGFQQHTAGIGRIAGALLMIAGIISVSIF